MGKTGQPDVDMPGRINRSTSWRGGLARYGWFGEQHGVRLRFFRLSPLQ